jgi:hypothetical protein
MALCHKSVREIAKNMAGAAYEELAKNDQFYTQHPNQNLFIVHNWKYFLGYARQSLVAILAGDYPDAVKADTMDVLLKDRVLQDVQEGPIMQQPVGSA